MISRLVVFGDDWGVPLIVRHLPPGVLAGVVCAANRPQYRAAVQACAVEAGVPWLVQPPSRAQEYGDFVSALAALRPDFLFVNSYSMLIRPEVIAASRFGGANLHPALLPDYRGANPIQWALLNNELETGVTIHRLIAEIDAGDILFQQRIPIRISDTWRDIRERIVTAADALLASALPEIVGGAILGTPQESALARRFRRRTADDGAIDWNQSVLRIYNLIRALVAPHPGAFFFDGEVRHQIETYRSLAEVTALKAEYGALCCREGGTRLVPLPSAGGNNDQAVSFGLVTGGAGAVSASLTLSDLDYAAGACRLIYTGQVPADLLRDGLSWLARYVRKELELAEIRVPSSLHGITSTLNIVNGVVPSPITSSQPPAVSADFVVA